MVFCMEFQRKQEIRKLLVGILEPDSNVRDCLKTISLPDEWIPTKEYYVRRNSILGVLSYGISKKKKIHKVNFWNSSANYYVSENAKIEKIPDSKIQEQINLLETTVIDFLIQISDGLHGWNAGNGVIKIIRNSLFYSLYYSNGNLAFNEHVSSMSQLEIEIRTIMDFVLKNGKLKVIELNEEMKEFISKKILILPKDIIKNKLKEPVNIKDSMLDFLIDSGLEMTRAKGKEKQILEEVNYGLQNVLESIDPQKKEVKYLTEENWDLILSNHKIFLETLPADANLKWERVGSSNESEVQYLSKKFPNHNYQGKFVSYKFKEFLLENISLRVVNISRTFFFDSKFTKIDFSNSISVFSRWKNNQLYECDFIGVDFSESEMVDCKFRESVFIKSDFESVIFEGCIFDSCDFSNARFKKTLFFKCLFRNCKFKGSRFIEAILYQSEFQNSDIQKAVNKNSEFNECNFS